MKLALLDAKTLGSDMDLSIFSKYGEFLKYETTSKDEVISRLNNVDILITNKVVIDKTIMDECPKLSLICLTSTGMNCIDLDYAKEKNIIVKNAVDYSTNSVAQHTFALLFGVLNQISYYDDYVKSGNWTKSSVFTHLDKTFWEINNKNWGIIGLGNIGKKVGNIAQTFGANVCYYSTSRKNNSDLFKRVELDFMLETCDIVSIHAPLNKNTYNLIDADQLSMMKQDSILINVGRGGIVNENALANFIENEKIFAGIDVLEEEPMNKNSPFLNLKHPQRIIFSPHIAWASIEARRKVIQIVCFNIESFLENKLRNKNGTRTSI